MKKLKLIIGSILLVSGMSYAQNVGINSTGAAPDAGAGLDIDFNDKGLLVPRVNITDLNTVAPITGSTTASLLVFNTNGTTGTGYHYWDGARWVRLAIGGESWKVDGNAGLNAANNFLGTTDNVPVRIRTNNVERFEFTTNGRLRSLNAGSSGNPTFSWTADSDVGMYRAAANQLAFSTGGDERIRVDNNGSVGIGTTTPFTSSIGGTNVNRLNIISNITPANSSMTEFMNSGDGLSIFANNSSTTNGFSAIEGTTNGANGVGVNGIHRPDQGIGFHGTGIGTRGVTNSYNGIGIYGSSPAIRAFGDLGAAGYFNGDFVWTGDAYNPSDRKLKKNIKNSESLLSNVLDLKVYSYDFDTTVFRLNNRADSHIGFIAQDLQEIFPELVAKKILYSRENASGNIENGLNAKSEEFLTVNYIGLIPILTKAIQEQQEQIESYEDRISQLESQVQQLLDNQ